MSGMYPITFAIVAVLALSTPAEAGERPVSGKASYAPTIGGSSVSSELGLTGVPLSIGAEVLAGSHHSYTWSAWARTAPVVPEERDAWGFVMGLNRHHLAIGTGLSTPSLSAEPLGYMVGFTYQRRWEVLWVRVTPSFTFFLNGDHYRYRNWLVPSYRSLLAGPAWLEAGFRLFPHVELSFRTTPAPIKLSIIF